MPKTIYKTLYFALVLTLYFSLNLGWSAYVLGQQGDAGPSNAQSDAIMPPDVSAAEEKVDDADIPTEKKSKNQSSQEETLTLVIPVVAAFLGAILTFFATQYTEKRNWERSQQDALREKQFNTISSVAKSIAGAVTGVLSIKTEIQDILVEANRSVLEDQAKKLQLNSQKATWITSVRSVAATLSLSAIELKLVSSPDKLVEVVSGMSRSLLSLVELLNEINDFSYDDADRRIEDFSNEISGYADKYVSEAQKYHRSFYEQS